MYRFFHRVTGVSDATAEPELVIEQDATLQCTPAGQVSELGSRTVHSFTKERALALKSNRRPRDGSDLVETLKIALRLQAPRRTPDYRILRPHRSRDYPLPHATPYLVQTEPGIHAMVYRLSAQRLEARPPHTGGPAMLYVAHHSSDRELQTEPWIRELLADEPGVTLYTCDVRGIGESRPDTCGQDMFLHPYGSDYFYAIHALMLGTPYVGRKTGDVLQVLEWLRSCGHPEVHLVGLGWGSLPATFAAVISATVTRVTLKHALTSYTAVAEAEDYAWPLSSFLPGVLEEFDLPDCYRALEAKRLRRIAPWGPRATEA